MAEFRPHEILAVLDAHDVRYVLIGGLAAVLHGAPHVTTDVDVVPEEAKRNLERLSAALEELGARIRVTGEPDGVPFDHSGESLARLRSERSTLRRTQSGGNTSASFARGCPGHSMFLGGTFVETVARRPDSLNRRAISRSECP